MAVYKIVITAKDNGDIMHDSDPIYETPTEARRSEAYHRWFDFPVKREVVKVVFKSKQYRGALFERATGVRVYGPVDPQDCHSDVDSILEAAIDDEDERKLVRKEIWEVST